MMFFSFSFSFCLFLSPVLFFSLWNYVFSLCLFFSVPLFLRLCLCLCRHICANNANIDFCYEVFSSFPFLSLYPFLLLSFIKSLSLSSLLSFFPEQDITNSKYRLLLWSFFFLSFSLPLSLSFTFLHSLSLSLLLSFISKQDITDSKYRLFPWIFFSLSFSLLYLFLFFLSFSLSGTNGFFLFAL